MVGNISELRLLIGSGDWAWPGHVKIDASPTSPADIHVMVPPLPEIIKAQRWNEIMAIHFLEHLAPWLAAQLLRECYECLSPGGVLILEQPDILYCAQVLLGEIEPPAGAAPGQFDMWGFFGSPETKDELMLHRWGWTPDTLAKALAAAGFTDIVREDARFHQPVRDFRLEGRR